MIVGITGTRRLLTIHQVTWLHDQMKYAHASHHGACMGADSISHTLALRREIPITVHPPVDLRYADLSTLVNLPGVTVLDKKPYLERNRDIANACEVLLALPDGPERVRSGTWSTIRYARKIGRRGWICFPDGSIKSLASV